MTQKSDEVKSVINARDRSASERSRECQFSKWESAWPEFLLGVPESGLPRPRDPSNRLKNKSLPSALRCEMTARDWRRHEIKAGTSPAFQPLCDCIHGTVVGHSKGELSPRLGGSDCRWLSQPFRRHKLGSAPTTSSNHFRISVAVKRKRSPRKDRAIYRHRDRHQQSSCLVEREWRQRRQHRCWNHLRGRHLYRPCGLARSGKRNHHRGQRCATSQHRPHTSHTNQRYHCRNFSGQHNERGVRRAAKLYRSSGQ